MEKPRIISIVPATEGMSGTFSEGGKPAVYPLACWALVEWANGGRSVLPMVAMGREAVLCDGIDGKHFVGFSRSTT